MQHLICCQDVWEQITATGSEQINLLTHIVLQFVKTRLGMTHLSLNLRDEKKMKLLLIKNNQQKKEVKTNKDISDLLEDILIPRYSRWEWLEDTLLLLLVKRFHCSHFQAETDLTELLHLLVCVGVQLLRNILHPEQSSSVLDPWLLHPVHRQPCVRNSSVTKRLHLLEQTAQRTSQRQPAGRTQWTKRRRRRILKPIAFD